MSSMGPQSNRFAPPVAHVEDVESVASGELAGRGTRLVAAIVDGLFVGLAMLVVALVTPYNVFDPREDSALFAFAVTPALAFGSYLLLNGWLLHSRGQTIAKAMLKIKVVRSDGRKASLPRLAGLRYFVPSLLALVPVFGWIFILVDSLLIFRDSRKCLHDNIADTIVVRA